MVLGPLKSLVKTVTWKCLRVAHVPRVLETLEQGNRYQGAYALRRQYLEPPPPTDPRHLAFHETKVFSQNGEDGIIQYILSHIGQGGKRFCEFGVEDGSESNCANLAIHFGWRGLMMDGDATNVARGRVFFRAWNPRTPDAVRFEHAWVTAENIEELLDRHGSGGGIDILSIDIDGNDYWVWKAMSNVRPRLLIMEYNAVFGPERVVTIPYEPSFQRFSKHPSGYYFGASLSALEKLARTKGYALIGCDSAGVNAFFLREDLLGEPFVLFDAKTAYVPQRVRLLTGRNIEDQFALIQHLPLEQV